MCLWSLSWGTDPGKQCLRLQRRTDLGKQCILHCGEEKSDSNEQNILINKTKTCTRSSRFHGGCMLLVTIPLFRLQKSFRVDFHHFPSPFTNPLPFQLPNTCSWVTFVLSVRSRSFSIKFHIDSTGSLRGKTQQEAPTWMSPGWSLAPTSYLLVGYLGHLGTCRKNKTTVNPRPPRKCRPTISAGSPSPPTSTELDFRVLIKPGPFSLVLSAAPIPGAPCT